MAEAQLQQIDTNPFAEVQWTGQKVLLASSEESSAKALYQLFSEEGMQVTKASDVDSTIEISQQERFDLMVIDTALDGNGLNAGHRIKVLMQHDFVPLLYVTNQSDELSLAGCFEAGGDDLIIRPFSETLLFARVNSLLKMGGIYKSEQKERKELAYYHSMMETEQRLAKSIFSSIVHQDHLDVGHIQYTLSPMSIFNGDMLLAASTPDGHEYILLGDFTGHGLTASVGTLPASEIFYAMTAKGFALGTIIGEVNKRLKKLLPLGMFMATYAIDVDYQESTISVWGGGIPDLLLRTAKDNKFHCIKAQNLPLGIVDSSDLNLEMQILPVENGDRFYIYTDGVTETENAKGEMFGTEALNHLIENAPHDENIFSLIMSGLEKFRAGFEQSDDITLLEYTFESEQAENYLNLETASQKSVSVNTDWSMNITLDPDAIRVFDPRPLLTQLVIDVQGLYGHRGRLYTIISELFRNAVDYGLLRMDTSIKQQYNGVAVYAEERRKKLNELVSGSIDINLKHLPEGKNSGVLEITITDTGEGFDYQNQKLPKMCKGLPLVTRLSDKIEFADNGRAVTVYCNWHIDSEN